MLPLMAGMLDMPLGRFLAVSVLAACGWSVAYLLPGWATGAALRLPVELAEFPRTEDNEALYLWLAAASAHAPTSRSEKPSRRWA